jgi:triosephosphate isomerase
MHHQQTTFTERGSAGGVCCSFALFTNGAAKTGGKKNVFVAAQNCYSKKNGAYTGEVSVEMLQSLGIQYVVLGHSERREYFHESNQLLADKVNICLEYNIKPIFCCGEPLHSRSGYAE